MIPRLPATYVAHLVSPARLGDVAGAHAAGELGSMVGGLGVRITLRYAQDGGRGAVIETAAGRPFGSAAAIAPISWLTGTLTGQTWEDATRHSPEGVLAALSDGAGAEVLPEAVHRAALFCVKALRRALGISQHGQPADCTGPGILVCRCIGVGDRTIREAITKGARTPEEIGERCGAGTGCRSCRPDLLALLDEEHQGLKARPLENGDCPISRITLARGGPTLRAQGMELLSARVGSERVLVRLGPPRTGAAISPPGALAILRHVLRETVGEQVEVGLDPLPPPPPR